MALEFASSTSEYSKNSLFTHILVDILKKLHKNPVDITDSQETQSSHFAVPFPLM